MCLEAEAIRAMFRRSSATVPTGSASAVNCVWTSLQGWRWELRRTKSSKRFMIRLRMLIGGFGLSAEDDALVFEVEGHGAEGGEYVGADEALDFAVALGGEGVGGAGGGHCGQFDGADQGVVENDWLHAGGAGHGPDFGGGADFLQALRSWPVCCPIR